MAKDVGRSVLFVLGVWGVGGVERVTVVLGNALAARGWRVTVVAFGIEERTLLEDFAPGVMVKALAFPVGSTGNVKALRALMAAREVRFVVNQWALPYGVTRLLRKAGRGLGVRFVAVLHNIPTNNGRIASARGVKRWLWRVLSGLNLRLTYRASDAFVVLSERFEPLFRRMAWLARSPKLLTLPNPLTLPPAPSVPKEAAVLYVGRLEETQKRVSRVLEVWRRLATNREDASCVGGFALTGRSAPCRANLPRQHDAVRTPAQVCEGYHKELKEHKGSEGWRLDIVGDGPDRAALERAAEGLPNVTFHGFQDPAPFYARARLLLLTSDFEGFSLVLVEAMAAGCVPVVLGSYPAAYDLVRGTNGVVVAPPFSAEGFARVVGDLMAHPAALDGMAEVARETAQTYSVEAAATRWETLFAELSGNAPSGTRDVGSEQKPAYIPTRPTFEANPAFPAD